MKYYKFLTEDNKGSNSGFDFTEYLPTDKPGKWLPKIDDIVMCQSGYHACKKADVFEWINAQMYVVEFRGKKLKGDNKDCAQEMRFVRRVENYNDKILRLFACWCAEEVLPIYEKKYPNDNRPRNAIEVAKRYANGKATKDELAAARTAAWTAAWDAARDAAWTAAWDAAWDAAWTAAWDAAWDAARKTQLRKFFEMVGG